jgi:acetyl esterase/lipase
LILNISCSPLKLADFLSPYYGYELESAIPYGTDKRHKLDIYNPSGLNTKKDVIIFVYGGSWRSGDRGDYRFIAQPFAAEGYTTIVPDYRLFPQTTFPGFVKDIAKVTAWVHRKYAGKNKTPRIILVGHSAGAHIVSLLALDKRYLENEGLSTKILRGWVALAGPHTFNPLKTASTRPIFETVKNNINEAKPISFARADAPPGLLLHGNSDTVVYQKNSTLLANAIKNKNGIVTSKSLEKIGHIGILLSIAEADFFQANTKEEILSFITSLNY